MDREKLYDRINRRVERMVEQGLEKEVKELINKCDSGMPPLQRSIGYKEWIPYFEGKTKLTDVVSQIQQNSRNFAKRQLTWFRKEKDIHWFEGSDVDRMIGVIEEFLR